MNNKGFTLVELLAIVVIISVIATVAVPNITNEINSSDKHTQNVVDESIENASKLYVAKYYAKQFINGEQIKFTLTDLENDGLLNLKSGVCDGFKNKDIVVNNHVYDYKELTKSCYSKSNKTGVASTPVTSPTPTTSPNPESESATPTTSPSPNPESAIPTTSSSCADITIKIPYWKGDERILVEAKSRSTITKISSAFYQSIPTNYTTNNESKGKDNKIAMCTYNNCTNNYKYLGVCATNQCGRQRCAYKKAQENITNYYYDKQKN